MDNFVGTTIGLILGLSSGGGSKQITKRHFSRVTCHFSSGKARKVWSVVIFQALNYLSISIAISDFQIEVRVVGVGVRLPTFKTILFPELSLFPVTDQKKCRVWERDQRDTTIATWTIRACSNVHMQSDGIGIQKEVLVFQCGGSKSAASYLGEIKIIRGRSRKGRTKNKLNSGHGSRAHQMNDCS